MGDKKTITLVLEAFGGSSLSATYTPEQLRGKELHQIVGEIMSKKYQEPEKMQTHALIREQMNASRGYIPSIGMGGLNTGQPAIFQPARLGDLISRYVNKPLPNDTLRITVNGDHEVGKQGDYHGTIF